MLLKFTYLPFQTQLRQCSVLKQTAAGLFVCLFVCLSHDISELMSPNLT